MDPGPDRRMVVGDIFVQVLKYAYETGGGEDGAGVDFVANEVDVGFGGECEEKV